jgi:hypothetical protein
VAGRRLWGTAGVYTYTGAAGGHGARLGASHQTGWTGLIARTNQLFDLLDAKRALAVQKQADFQPTCSA